jgi:hypothetical protein
MIQARRMDQESGTMDLRPTTSVRGNFGKPPIWRLCITRVCMARAGPQRPSVACLGGRNPGTMTPWSPRDEPKAEHDA